VKIRSGPSLRGEWDEWPRDITLSVVPVTASIHRMPTRAPGTAARMMNGSSHDWKRTTISR